MSDAALVQRSKNPGRPRRLTLKAVIEAASALGLDNLSMGAVAARLGVGIATLYTYVKSREELERLVAASRAWRPHLVEAGQHWSEIVRAHVKGLYDLFSAEPQLMVQLIAGAMAPEDELDELEAFIALLAARGFSGREAFAIYRTASQIAFGAAVGGARMRNLNIRGERRHVALAKAFAEREPDELPHLRALGGAFADDAIYNSYDDALDMLLARIAAARGEPWPAPPSEPGRTKRRKRS